MSLENILCPAQQIQAVIELLLDDAQKRIPDQTVVYSLYSVMDNINRIMKAVDVCFEHDDLQCKILTDLGVYSEFFKRYTAAI